MRGVDDDEGADQEREHAPPAGDDGGRQTEQEGRDDHGDPPHTARARYPVEHERGVALRAVVHEEDVIDADVMEGTRIARHLRREPRLHSVRPMVVPASRVAVGDLAPLGRGIGAGGDAIGNDAALERLVDIGGARMEVLEDAGRTDAQVLLAVIAEHDDFGVGCDW